MAEKKFVIEVRSKGFGRANRDIKQLDTSSKSYSKTVDQIRGRTQGFMRSLGSLRNSILLYSFAIAGAGKVTSSFVSAARKFEDVKVRLVGLMGGALDAERAFKKFNTVAAKTPFTLDDVVNAGAQLKAFGADAEALLGPITDLAAFMGTTASEAANAFGRAYAGGAGAADIFREKGILNIIKDFKGIDNITDLTLPQFRQAMVEAFTDPSTGIAGSTARMSETFTGVFSNMTDSVTRLAAEIGSMLMPALKASMQRVGEFADSSREFIEFARTGRENFDMFGSSFEEFMAKVRGMSLASAREELAALQSQVEINSQTMSEAGDIVSMSPIIPDKAVDNLKIFTKEMKDGKIDLDQFKDGSFILSPILDDIADALDKDTQALDTTGTGTVHLTKKIKFLEQAIKDLMATEAERLDIMSDDDMDERIRKERILVLKTIAKFEDEQRKKLEKHTDQLADEEIARLERGAMLAAGMDEMVLSTKKTADHSNAIASGLLMAGQAMASLRTDSEITMGQMIRTIGSIVSLIPGGQIPGAVMQGIGMLTAHTGGLIKDNGIQRFAQGGQVQGQDNVPILAQAGEFIMKRDAVQNIGVQNLANMNRTGNSGGVTVNISGNMIGNDEFVRDNLIPEIQKVSNQGLA